MGNDVLLLGEFAERVRISFPDYASHVAPIPATHPLAPCHELMSIPYPLNPLRCRLSACFRSDCFEISFSVAGTRGPAETQIVGRPNGPRTIVEDAILFLDDFFSERIVVVIERYPSLWSRNCHLPFFRMLSERSNGRRVCEVLSWRGTYNESQQTS